MNYKPLLISAAVTGSALVGGVGLSLARVASASAAGTDTTTATTASTSSTSSTTSTNQDTSPPAVDQSKGGHTANGITEEILTGDNAAKVTAAANAAVPNATIMRVETDAEGATYEAHMKKSDGTVVTVKLDANFNVTATEDGMGARPGGTGR